MKCSAFIATTLDGYIADKDNGLDWLNINSDIKVDMGFDNYLSNIDSIVMGRNTMETISKMNLRVEEWPYSNIPIIVLSSSLKTLPGLFKSRGEIYSGDIKELMKVLKGRGYNNIYIDGGKTIQSFIESKLLNSITISMAPTVLGSGIPLFGTINKGVILSNPSVKLFPNDFIQLQYDIV